jgi:hypothetical protein
MDNDISIFFDVFVKTTEGFRYEEIAGVVTLVYQILS